jgi:hypothetical protein
LPIDKPDHQLPAPNQAISADKPSPTTPSHPLTHKHDKTVGENLQAETTRSEMPEAAIQILREEEFLRTLM